VSDTGTLFLCGCLLLLLLVGSAGIVLFKELVYSGMILKTWQNCTKHSFFAGVRNGTLTFPSICAK